MAASLSTPSMETYSTACSRILEIIASPSKHTDYEITLDSVSYCLAMMIPMLNNTNTVRICYLANT
jgi:hypothetical protein